jgi:hypothetical protein
MRYSWTERAPGHSRRRSLVEPTNGTGVWDSHRSHGTRLMAPSPMDGRFIRATRSDALAGTSAVARRAIARAMRMSARMPVPPLDRSRLRRIPTAASRRPAFPPPGPLRAGPCAGVEDGWRSGARPDLDTTTTCNTRCSVGPVLRSVMGPSDHEIAERPGDLAFRQIARCRSDAFRSFAAGGTPQATLGSALPEETARNGGRPASLPRAASRSYRSR